MRLLLISYEYPPIESAQSFRWHYLSRHLVRSGADVTVLTPEIPALPTPEASAKLQIVRTYPGPFVGLSATIAAKMRGTPAGSGVGAGAVGESLGESAYRSIRKILDKLIFPDVRTEWYPYARKRLQDWTREDFDLVIASHEPGVDLMLGMHASKRWNLPLVIDLADPLVTPYSPGWRKSFDQRLERLACGAASGIITTSSLFSADLLNRYQLQREQIIEIEQGFEKTNRETPAPTARPPFPADDFWLLFTGNFYRDFRNPSIILEAMKRRPQVKLAYAGHVSGWLAEQFRPFGAQVRCLGRMSHRDVLGLQRSAPVLFSLGNSQAQQVPGKLYEYFGAGRPILHVALNPQDSSKQAVSTSRRGIAVDAEADEVVGALDRLCAAWAVGRLGEVWDLSEEAVEKYSWAALSGKLLGFLQRQLSARTTA